MSRQYYITDLTGKRKAMPETKRRQQMIFIMNTSINLDTLDVEELMDVKGGIADKAVICAFASAVKCTVAGSGVIVQKPSTSIDK